LVVQRLVETILFFHPVVWWISRRMEVAREEACDDLVVATGCDPVDYAEVLLICSELRQERSPAATTLAGGLAATGQRRGPLENRILRLLGNGDQGTVRLGRAGWGLGLFLLGGVALALAAGNGQRSDNTSEVVAAVNPTGKLAAEPANAREFGVAVADQVVEILESHRLPFITKELLQQARSDFASFVQSHCREDLSLERQQAILAALKANGAGHLALDGHGQRDLRKLNGTYLSLPDTCQSLQWKLFLALSREPLSPSELKEQERQRQWMRDFVKNLPETSFGKVQPELAKLESTLQDPLCPIMDRPMSEEQFSHFQKQLESDPLGKQLNFVVFKIVHHVLETTHPRMESFRLPFEDRVVSTLLSGTFISLGFESNRPFVGSGVRSLHSIEESYSVVDASTGYPDSAPPNRRDAEGFAAWLQAQGKGDLGLSLAPYSLVALRGAKLALLDVENWIEADAIRNDALRAIILKQDKKRIELEKYYQANRDSNDHYVVPYAGILTTEGRLAVVAVEDFSGRNDIAYRLRPRLEKDPSLGFSISRTR
jgi:hypothetical protein